MTQVSQKAIRVLSASEYAALSTKDADTLYFIHDGTGVTINFVLNGGTGDASATYLYGETIGGLPVPTKSGCTFGGWYTDSGLTTAVNTSTVVTSTQTFYAKWNTATVVLTFEDRGNMTTTTVDSTIGDTFASYLPEDPPERTGWKFCGWAPYVGAQTWKLGTRIKSTDTVPSTATTYYAKWMSVLTPCNGTIRIVAGLDSGGQLDMTDWSVHIYYNGTWYEVPDPATFSWNGGVDALYFTYNRSDNQCYLGNTSSGDASNPSRLYTVDTQTVATSNTNVTLIQDDLFVLTLNYGMDGENRRYLYFFQKDSTQDLCCVSQLFSEYYFNIVSGGVITLFIPPIKTIDQVDTEMPTVSHHTSASSYARRVIAYYGKPLDDIDAYDNETASLTLALETTNDAAIDYTHENDLDPQYACAIMKTSA